MNPARTGYLFGLSAYLCWGLFPLYWKLLRPAGAVEILAHRIVWSFVFVLLVIATVDPRAGGAIAALLRQPRTVGLVALAAVLIAVNWGTYIYGVNTDRVVETSLGLLHQPAGHGAARGRSCCASGCGPAQWAAIGIGAVAVAVLTVDYGHVPYLALTLAAASACTG